MELGEEIRGRATFDGRLVRIDAFLNHRVEPELLRRVGSTFGDRVRRHEAGLILTAEASGIPVAAATSIATGVPFVYAKKYDRPPAGTLARTVTSATRGIDTVLAIDPVMLPPSERIVIVDDVLAGGSAALALIDMARSAGCLVSAACVVIDKPFAGGRRRLADLGVEVHALVTYETEAELGLTTVRP